MTPLSDFRALVRRDLKDENPATYRWTDDEVDRAIQRAVLEYSQFIPRYQKDTVATVSAQDYIDISTLSNRVKVYKVEFPVGQFPRKYQPFRVWMNHLIFMGDDKGTGGNCYVEWGKVHSLDVTTNSVDAQHQHTVALGAAAYAVLNESQYQVNRTPVGGTDVDMDYLDWGNAMLKRFHAELYRIKRNMGAQRMISDEIYYKEGA
jgi:hypothetical protein